MVHYKLHYFDGRGLAETIRQLFELADHPYEDVRYTLDGWAKHKKEMPFGQVPVLEVNGKMIPQSFAIARYVAKQFGFAGKNDFEAAWVDAYGDQLKDHLQELLPLHNVLIGMKPGDKEMLRVLVGEPARDKFFSLIEKQLKANFTGYLVGEKVTWIDLALAEHVDLLLGYMPDFLNDYPAVLAHRLKIHAMPNIHRWLNMRPKETPPRCPYAVTEPTKDDLKEMERQSEEELMASMQPERCPIHIFLPKKHHV